VTLLDSLLDAIVRLDGQALIMHAGEKPFVVLSSASESSFRGPLSWGQVELSSRPLTTEALVGMLAQMLSSDQTRMLEEVGAIEHEIDAPGHSGERFIVTAARGGEDVWIEVRRRPKEGLAEPGMPPQPIAPSRMEIAPQDRTAPSHATERPGAAGVEAREREVEGEPEVLFEIATAAPYVQRAADRVDTDEIGAPAAAAFEISESVPLTELPDLIGTPAGSNAGAEAALAAEVEAFAARKAAVAAEAETALAARAAALSAESERMLAARIASLGAEAEAALAAKSEVLAADAQATLAAREAALASDAEAALAAREGALAAEAGVMITEKIAALAAEAEAALATREAALVSEARAAFEVKQAALAAEAESALGARVAALAAAAEAALAARETALVLEAETALAAQQAALAAEADTALAAKEAELGARAETILAEKISALASEAQAALTARETALASETHAALAAKQADLAAEAETALAARIAALAGNAEQVLAAREAEVAAQLKAALAAEAALGAQLEGALAARETELAAREAVVASLAEHAEATLTARASAAAAAAEAALSAKIASLAEQAEAALAARESALAAESEAALAAKVAVLTAQAEALAGREAARAAASEQVLNEKIAALAAGAEAMLAAKEAALAAEAETAIAATLAALAAAARPAADAGPATFDRTAHEQAAGPLNLWSPAASDTFPAAGHADADAVASNEPAVVVPLSRPALKLQPPAPPPDAPAASTEASLVELLRAVTAHRASTLFAVVDTRPMMRVEGRIALAGTQAPIAAGDVERFIFEFAPREQVAHAAPEWTCTVPGVGRVRCVAFHDHSGTGLIFHLPVSDSSSADEIGLGRHVQALCGEADGLVVVAGPRSSGKSTLLNAFVDLINRTRYDHVITIESQIRVIHQKRLSFISQREVHGDGDAIAEAARAALREGPDVLVIEDLRAPEALVAALDAARAGRLVFGSISASTAPVAVERLIDAFPAERRPQVRASLAGALRAVVAQLLVPGIAGGRIAAREVLLSSPAVRKLILHGATWQLPIAIESGRGLGMTTMVDSLGALVRDGAVSIGEACGCAPDRAGLIAALERDGVDVSNVERRA
jgi:twitching motility protein PilT